MEIVLLERVEKLGQMGDVVQVRDGYARNFLLPKGKALRATKGNLARFEAEKAQLEARNLELKKEAEAVAGKMDGQQFIAIRSASDAGSLYGSVNSRDIADLATDGGFSIARGQIVLDKPVKELGIHTVRVVLHPEVSANIEINVARSEDEAELQAQGKSIAELRAEEEAAEAFDVAELFEDEAEAEALLADGEEGEAEAEAPIEDAPAEDDEQPRV
ncbi:MAG: 50S ribosomal protein L9 [Pseudomonadota bacterium]